MLNSVITSVATSGNSPSGAIGHQERSSGARRRATVQTTRASSARGSRRRRPALVAVTASPIRTVGPGSDHVRRTVPAPASPAAGPAGGRPARRGAVCRANSHHGCSPARWLWCAAALVAAGWPRAGVALWLVSRIGDGLDGAIARQRPHVRRLRRLSRHHVSTWPPTRPWSWGSPWPHPALWLAWLVVMAGYVAGDHDHARAVGRGTRRRPIRERHEPHVPVHARRWPRPARPASMYVLWALVPDLEWLVWTWARLVTALQRTLMAARLLR